VVVTVWALSNLGMLVLATGLLLAYGLTRFPLTFDGRAWFADTSLLTLLLATSLAVVSFILAKRGRPAVEA
jgi:hypothetical protein